MPRLFQVFRLGGHLVFLSAVAPVKSTGWAWHYMLIAAKSQRESTAARPEPVERRPITGCTHGVYVNSRRGARRTDPSTSQSGMRACCPTLSRRHLQYAIDCSLRRRNDGFTVNVNVMRPAHSRSLETINIHLPLSMSER